MIIIVPTVIHRKLGTNNLSYVIHLSYHRSLWLVTLGCRITIFVVCGYFTRSWVKKQLEPVGTKSPSLKDDNVHELPLSKSQPPLVWKAISSVCTVEQSSTCFLPYLLQIIPQQFCFLLGLGKSEKSRERKPWFPRYRNFLQSQINDCFSPNS